jgi:hypothetical protein
VERKQPTVNTQGVAIRIVVANEYILAFLKDLPWLEEQDMMAGYAWFPFERMRHRRLSTT